jgi:Flp pilus assembly protein TadG
MKMRRDERGDAATEAVLVAPVLIFLVFTIIQFGLWYHASNVARASAQEGVSAARVSGGTANKGQATAESFLAQTGGSLIHGTSVVASRTQDVADVTVNGTVTAVVPGLHLGVSGHASAPVERFRAPTQ